MGDEGSRATDRLRRAASCVGKLLLVAYGLQLLNALLGYRLSLLGIRPRTLIGLVGIPLHPVLHASFGHLLVNTFPFAVLGGLVAVRGVGEFLELSLFVVLVEGAILWLFGRSGAVYLGASGLVFGYFGYLVARGWYERATLSALVSVVVLLVYSGLIWGILPVRAAVAWESHLLGLVAGILAARLAFGRSSSSARTDSL